MGDMENPTLLEVLCAERDRLRRSRWARNTERSYAYDWAMFQAWCERLDRAALPATSETLSLFLADVLSAGKKVATAVRRAAAIAHYHRQAGEQNPMTPEVRELLTAAQRMRGEQPRQVRPLLLEDLRQIAKVLWSDQTDQSTRDLAVLVIGFASALRRSNIVALSLCDVEFTPHGLVLRIGREKQDQAGRGRLIGLPAGAHPETDPVRCLGAWLRVRGSDPGRLFLHLDGRQLRTDYVARIVRRCVERIGLDPREYAGHSLRAGFVTSAGEAGAGEMLIAAQTGHRSMDVLRKYFRRTDVFKTNACSIIGL